MNKTYKRIWLRALRGGSKAGVYHQGKDFLCYLNPSTGEDNFCCLGVIANETVGLIDHKPPQVGGTEGRHFNGEGIGSSAVLPPWLLWKLGLKDWEQDELVLMNDRGDSFEKIACWIEENL